MHLPNKIAGKESKWNEENAVEDRDRTQEDQDQREMIAQIEIGPPPCWMHMMMRSMKRKVSHHVFLKPSRVRDISGREFGSAGSD